jgi:hypothetical protein
MHHQHFPCTLGVRHLSPDVVSSVVGSLEVTASQDDPPPCTYNGQEMACSLVECWQHFGRTCCFRLNRRTVFYTEDGYIMFLRNFGNLLPDHTSSHKKAGNLARCD